MGNYAHKLKTYILTVITCLVRPFLMIKLIIPVLKMLPQIFHSTSFISQKSILDKHYSKDCNNYRETRRRSSSPWVGKIYVQCISIIVIKEPANNIFRIFIVQKLQNEQVFQILAQII